MPQKARTIADQTLDELEGVAWGPPMYESSLVSVEELPNELRAARARLAALHGSPAAA